MSNPLQKLALTTDTGQNWKGIFYIIFTYIVSMPESNTKTGLLVFWGVIMALVSFLTKGYEAAKPPMPDIDDEEDLGEALARDRDRG